MTDSTPAADGSRPARRAYVVNQVVVHDAAAYAVYAAAGRDAVTRYGGRILAAGGNVETLEGEPIPPRVVLIEFPDRDAALAYYHSEEYQAARATRGDAATVRFAIVDGVELVEGVDGGR